MIDEAILDPQSLDPASRLFEARENLRLGISAHLLILIVEIEMAIDGGYSSLGLKRHHSTNTEQGEIT
jgi:hypothetical protein